MLNLLRKKRALLSNALVKPARRHRALSRKSIMLIVGLVLSVCIVVLVVGIPTRAAYVHGLRAKSQLLEAKALLEKQDFSHAITTADSAKKELEETMQNVNRLRGLEPTPVIGIQVKALRILCRVAIMLSNALRDGTVAADQILGPLNEGEGTISLATLTPADKRQILKRISESKPLLEAVQHDIQSTTVIFDTIPQHGLFPQIESVLKPLREQLPFVEDTVTQLIPASTIIPAIAGFPNLQTYLFLLQNNTELRPTGGFIGTYGVLKVSSGDITSFVTNDVYTLDTPAHKYLKLTPPSPLTKYNDTTQWLFRDSNWSPDFPTSAQKALEFYRLENGPQKYFDGVIAVTPTFVSSLLKISGPVTIGSVTFTTDNLVDKLQPRADRKELIGDMSKVLMTRLLSLPVKRWNELLAAISKALEQKQMLLFSRDPSLEQQILAQNWSGALQTQTIDSLFVVDANLASLKTDSVMSRKITYKLLVTAETATATASITYTNSGKFTSTTTRYRTYTRVYVPQGSTLTASSGALNNDKLHGARPGTVDISQELGKTIFGAFISIEPGETGTLSFTYTLPQNVVTAIREGTYNIIIQKQAGTKGHELAGSVTFPEIVHTLSGIDGATGIGHTTVDFNTDLKKDRLMTVTFK